MNKKLLLIALPLFALGGVLISNYLAQQDLQPADNQYPEKLELAEAFITSFYSWQPNRINGSIADAESQSSVLYYQGWAEAGNYQIKNRQPCYEARNGLVYCAITVTDDIGGTLGYIATDTFELSISDDQIETVQFAGDDPFIFTMVLAWMYFTKPEVFDGPCKDMFAGGTTPGICVRAVIDGAREYQES